MKIDVSKSKLDSTERSNAITSTRKRSVGAVLTLAFIIIVCLTFSVTSIYFIASKHIVKVNIVRVFDDDNRDNLSIQLKPGTWKKILTVIEGDSGKEDEKIIGSSLTKCSNVEDEHRFDCHPDSPATEEGCLARGCCWKLSSRASILSLKAPHCYYPSDYLSYNITSVRRGRRRIYAYLKRLQPSGFFRDIENVSLQVRFYDSDMLRIQLKDADQRRYEVPLPNIRDNLKQREIGINRWRRSKQYKVQLKNSGELIVTRWSSHEEIFCANLSRLVFSDQFLQLSSMLPSHYIYGLGQHKSSFLHSTAWQRLTLFNFGPPPMEGKNLYGSHPFYLSIENDGNANGVFLFNSNPMDIVLQPAPAITYRPIGGIFDFFIFLGPSPDEVVQQYTRLIGRPFMPPYWSLGFHLCKYNYSSLENTKAAWNRTRLAGIPFDTQWNDIDYMISKNDFTYDKTRYSKLPEFVDELHNIGMHYMQILDPGISNTELPGTYPPYDEGVEMDVFVKNSSGQLFMGKVWNKDTSVFTDFMHPNGTQYWIKQFQRYYSEVNIDGAWIDMNEPTSFYDGQANGCPNSTYNTPQYLPGGDQPLYKMTLCMTARHYNELHYNVHNLYALSEAMATSKALSNIRKKRPFIISRASSPGLGHYSGNWDGDIYSTWEDMRWTIPSILNFNMFGIPMTGGDICGFKNNTNAELCARWSALGAFYPFSRNHNSNNTIDQDPVSLGPRVVTAAKEALTTRYFLLPYLYTLFFRSHAFGEAVARPLVFEYPGDRNTYAIDRQFLWGSSLMVIPVLDPNVQNVTGYFPDDVWYDFYTGHQYEETGCNITLGASTDRISLAVRGGSIIPAQKASTTTTKSRLNKFSLIVALKPHRSSYGDLYLDDGDSIDSFASGNYSWISFVAIKYGLLIFPRRNGYTSIPSLGSIKLFGFQSKPKSVTVNGQPKKFDYDSFNKVLRISELELYLLSINTILWVISEETSFS